MDTNINLSGAEMEQQNREAAVHALLESIPGEDCMREGLLDTPNRVHRMYNEIFAGYTMDPAKILSTTFDAGGSQDMVVLSPIRFYSMCEHHMMPFIGEAHIAYIPNGRVVGISKLGRLVDVYAKRLQIQERMTTQIANDIQKYLNPLGVAVVLRAEHLCMSMRGVQKPGTKTITASLSGIFKLDEKARQEFYDIINVGGR